jgi:hypothetical protein
MVTELEEVPMSIVGGLDIHRQQLTFDYVEQETGRWERGRIVPADREHLAGWLARFTGTEPVAFAVEAGTGWRYVAEEMRTAGVQAHLAEPADTSVLRRCEAAGQDRPGGCETVAGVAGRRPATGVLHRRELQSPRFRHHANCGG